VRGYEIGVLLDHMEANGGYLATVARFEIVFARLLDQHRTSRALHATLDSEPSLFVDLVSRVYRGRNQPRRQLSEVENLLARQAWWILQEWSDLPGRRQDGTIDGDHLKQWVRDARLALADNDRADIGVEQIGQVLAGLTQRHRRRLAR
jgi:hypothetical protein